MLLQDFIAYRNSLKVEPSAAKATSAPGDTGEEPSADDSRKEK